jgi:hypothetical protein
MVSDRRAYRLFVNGLAVVAFVGIGGLQMFGVDGGVVTSYGADLLAPPILYFAFREGYGSRRRGRVWRLSPKASLLTVLAGCTLWEVGQRFDVSGTPLFMAAGTFDPVDLLMYAVGLLACYQLDVRWLAPRGITPGPRQGSPP